jgi:hypothetical protein
MELMRVLKPIARKNAEINQTNNNNLEGKVYGAVPFT